MEKASIVTPVVWLEVWFRATEWEKGRFNRERVKAVHVIYLWAFACAAKIWGDFVLPWKQKGLLIVLCRRSVRLGDERRGSVVLSRHQPLRLKQQLPVTTHTARTGLRVRTRFAATESHVPDTSRNPLTRFPLNTQYNCELSIFKHGSLYKMRRSRNLSNFTSHPGDSHGH